MLVRMLIGARAGEIEDVRHDAAEANLANGTCAALTDAERDDYLDSQDRMRRGEDDLDLGFGSVGFATSDATGRVISQGTRSMVRPAHSTMTDLESRLAAKSVIAADDSGAFIPSPGDVETLTTLRDRFEFPSDAAAITWALQYALEGTAESDEDAEPETHEGEVVIPSDWKTLHHAKRRSLAQAISGEKPESTEAADEVIQAEVDKRPA